MENQETSVGAFIYKIEKEKILFLLIYSKRNNEWGFPKGHIEPDETELETAKREIKEETGYSTKNIKKLTSFYPSTAFSNEELIIYIAKDLVSGKQNPDASCGAWFSLQCLSCPFPP